MGKHILRLSALVMIAVCAQAVEATRCGGQEEGCDFYFACGSPGMAGASCSRANPPEGCEEFQGKIVATQTGCGEEPGHVKLWCCEGGECDGGGA